MKYCTLFLGVVLITACSLKCAEQPQPRQQSLLDASRNRDLEAIQICIAAGEDVNVTDQKGNTSAHLVAHVASRASVHQCAKIIALLKDAKADLSLKNKAGKTALEIAQKSQLPTLYEALGLQEVLDSQKHMALMKECLQEKPVPETIHVMLKNGANPFFTPTSFEMIVRQSPLSSKEKLKMLQYPNLTK